MWYTSSRLIRWSKRKIKMSRGKGTAVVILLDVGPSMSKWVYQCRRLWPLLPARVCRYWKREVCITFFFFSQYFLQSIHTSHAHSFLTRVCRTQEGEENSNLMKAVKAVSCTRLMDQLCFTAAAHRKDFNRIPLSTPHSKSPLSSN